MEECNKCRKRIKGEAGIRCEGVCGKNYHKTTTCAGMDEYSSNVLSNCLYLRFMCDDCMMYISNVDDALKQIIEIEEKNKIRLNEQKEEIEKEIKENNRSVYCMLEKKEKEIECVLYNFQKTYKEEWDKERMFLAKKLEELESLVKEKCVVNGKSSEKASKNVLTEMKDDKKAGKTYADQLRIPMIVKPKMNKKQSSETTKKEIKEKISPSSLSVEVMKITELKNNGAISIKCSNKNSVEKIESEITKKLGDSYDVRVPKLLNPRMLIVGMSEELTGEKIIDAIKKQNNVEIKEVKCIKVYKSSKAKCMYNAIIEVDGSAFQKMMDIGRVNIEWDRCKVYESLRILRCFKCWAYGHKAEECRNGSCCFKCGDNKHVAKDCQVKVAQCLNCCRARESLGLKDLKVDHETKSLECPTYLRRINSMKNKTLYY